MSEFTLGRPYHAALCRVSPRNTNATHTHQDFYEVFYVLSGCGEHRLSLGCQPLRGGDIVLVRPTDSHYLIGQAPTGLEWINVAVPIATWSAVLDFAEIASANDWHRSQLPKRATLTGETAVKVESSFREALERFSVNPRRLVLLRFILDVFEVLADPGEMPDCALRPVWLVRACTTMSREDNLRGGVN